MTKEVYNKAAELLGNMNGIQGKLKFFSIVQTLTSPCELCISDGRGHSCPIPPTIEKLVVLQTN